MYLPVELFFLWTLLRGSKASPHSFHTLGRCGGSFLFVFVVVEGWGRFWARALHLEPALHQICTSPMLGLVEVLEVLVVLVVSVSGPAP